MQREWKHSFRKNQWHHLHTSYSLHPKLEQFLESRGKETAVDVLLWAVGVVGVWVTGLLVNTTALSNHTVARGASRCNHTGAEKRHGVAAVSFCHFGVTTTAL